MASSSRNNRPKMERENRAKQFMPFDALKGFREALAEKEREVEQREQKAYRDDGDEDGRI